MGLSRHEIASVIVAADPAFEPLLSHVGPPPARRGAPVSQRFADLIQSISHQLLATKAASTIHARVVDLLEGRVEAEAVLALSTDELRAVGLSRTKAEAMRELAACSLRGDIDFSRHGRLSDQDIANELTQVRGIGPWTAQMYLMFTLGRPDVWPAGDFGVRHGWSVLHELEQIISEADLRRAGDAFVGVRSSVADYCWAAVDESGWLTARAE